MTMMTDDNDNLVDIENGARRLRESFGSRRKPTANDVKQLRELTGNSMSACKNELMENYYMTKLADVNDEKTHADRIGDLENIVRVQYEAIEYLIHRLKNG